ncbi:hypothetical protein PAMP_011443 [Pampus punctatissimus]
MEENAHCPSPEKLSSLAFLPFNEFFVCVLGSGEGSLGFRGTELYRAEPSRAEPQCQRIEARDGQRPAECRAQGQLQTTTWYRAPEVMLHISFNKAIDMRSLGLGAAEMATGYLPYPRETDPGSARGLCAGSWKKK